MCALLQSPIPGVTVLCSTAVPGPLTLCVPMLLLPPSYFATDVCPILLSQERIVLLWCAILQFPHCGALAASAVAVPSV